MAGRTGAGRRPEHRRWFRRVTGGILGLLCSTGSLAAQKDYYNTDRNRPVRIEDAYPTERYALEVKIAPLRLERGSGGLYHWELEPEVAYGILPRTSLELGLPIAIRDAGDAEDRTSGVAGLHLSAFHNLNIETRTLPALAMRADLSLPVGSLGGSHAYGGLTGIATRTFTWARVHVNGRYTIGPTPDPDAESGAAGSRWLAGVAADRAFPLDALLLIAEVYASQPLAEGADLDWHAGGGIRYQLNPYLALDAGLGTRLNGSGQWYITLGTAYHVGLRALMPPR